MTIITQTGLILNYRFIREIGLYDAEDDNRCYFCLISAKNDKGEDMIEYDSDPVSKFLYTLQNCVISDDEIIRILRKTWTGEAVTRGRNNAAMSYAGVLCKAGVDANKAKSFIEELIPNFDLTEIIEYAYNHNVFGCQRREYRKKK